MCMYNYMYVYKYLYVESWVQNILMTTEQTQNSNSNVDPHRVRLLVVIVEGVPSKRKQITLDIERSSWWLRNMFSSPPAACCFKWLSFTIEKGTKTQIAWLKPSKTACSEFPHQPTCSSRSKVYPNMNAQNTSGFV